MTTHEGSTAPRRALSGGLAVVLVVGAVWLLERVTSRWAERMSSLLVEVSTATGSSVSSAVSSAVEAVAVAAIAPPLPVEPPDLADALPADPIWDADHGFQAVDPTFDLLPSPDARTNVTVLRPGEGLIP